MKTWQQQHSSCEQDIVQLAEKLNLCAADAATVAQRYPVLISHHIMALIADGSEAIRRQFVPDIAELDDDAATIVDPLNEEALSPVPHLVHRYPQRVLLLAAGSCFSYCRFCTRKRKVGCADMAVSFGDLLKGIDYIAAHGEINEVIISGGDPLTMSDALLADLLKRLRRIPHVQVLRVGSRAPVVLPQRITPQLCNLLRQHQPLYFLTHFNHPDELTPAAITACTELVSAGIPLVNQTVLLRGINDEVQILQRLFFALHRLCIRPYYLHQMDLTIGTGHFRTSLERGIAIMDALRGPLSGLAVPTYIVDLPGGHGKVPITPDYIKTLGINTKLRAANGTIIDYPNVIQAATH